MSRLPHGFAVAVMMLSACVATPDESTVRGIESNDLAVLQPGHTSRADALLLLGRPFMRFEDDRLLLFRMTPPHRRHGMQPLQWDGHVGTEYHVTLRFDSEGTLQDFRAVRR